ncbi:pirin family protein [Mesorhizobium intechi]|uniref:Pirin family protein n=1 Tax=Mesorhizobium intechi TaxID=537601 RepID=A0A8T9ARK9_9HYPH|nr:pirin family protein [Mesorhizobium intechi]TSE07861.1 pirin family protein [Mesorhizobium intechi]
MTDQQSSIAGIDTVILPMALRRTDGFKVRRVLPLLNRRTVGPFIQFYHFGPEEFDAGQGFDMRPHTHDGLAALTYLVDGEIILRNTLGRMQTILPGEVNWMTTGSEMAQRPSTEFRASGSNLLGVQACVALPLQHEDVASEFAHFASSEIPRICADGVEFTLIAGTSDGLISPVRVFSETILAEIVLTGSARYQLKPEHRDRAIYVIAGEVGVVGQSGTFGEGALIVLTPGIEIVLQAPAFHAARLMLFGGGPLADAPHV